MSSFTLIQGSCVNQTADAVVNAANCHLAAGTGVCGAIYAAAGFAQLNAACRKYQTPLVDGSAVLTPAFGIKNAKAIIHAVGPDFRQTKRAFKELYDAYYNSLLVLRENDLHSIAFPLISAGVFAGPLTDPAGESAKQCCRAYAKFTETFPDYEVDVKLCAFSPKEMSAAQQTVTAMGPQDASVE